MHPTFPTPLPRSARSDILEWRLPKPHGQYVLTGKSRAAWHTSFVIPQLNLLLDAGLVVNNQRPKHIFLTHGHSDHTLLCPAFVQRDDPPDIYCPAEMRQVLDDFILAETMLNLGGLVSVEEAQAAGGDVGGLHEEDYDGPPLMGRLNTHISHGVAHGDEVPLPRAKDVSVEVFSCDHSIPCVGYVFKQTTQRLRPEYHDLPGHELKSLRESGVEITAPHSTPMFAFLGDTTAATLAAEPAWLGEGIPAVITECSFLYEEHRTQAAKTKHTLWSDLEKIVRKWPETTFILMHFSLRYSDDDVRRFFADLADPPSNIVVWIDGQPDPQ